MARAGYDPRASLDLWTILKEVEEDAEANIEADEDGVPFSMERLPFMRTHPTGGERLAVRAT